MAYIQRANVILQVKDSEVDYYINLGYNEITKDGKVIRETIPTDVHTLQKYYVDSKKKIAQLEAEIASLKAQPSEKAKSKKEVETTETEPKKRTSTK